MSKYRSLQDLPGKPKGTVFELVTQDGVLDEKKYKALVHNEVLCLKCEADKFDEMIVSWFEKIKTTQELVLEAKCFSYPHHYFVNCSQVKLINSSYFTNTFTSNKCFEVLGTDDILICETNNVIIVNRNDDLSKYVSDVQLAQYMRTRQPNNVIQIADDIIFGTNNFSPPNPNNPTNYV